MGTKVVKFGGSSLASAAQIVKAMDIVRSDPDRRYVVASAPGKRTPDDTKVTDLLYQVYGRRDGDYGETLSLIKRRFTEIAQGLGVRIDLAAEFREIEYHLRSFPHQDDARHPQGKASETSGYSLEYMASRGEYLNSKIIAAYLEWPFVDAEEVVRFTESGEFDAESTDNLLASRLGEYEHAVIPGFYGAMPSGRTRIFPRGGSDVTGALVARAVDADVYENWTDVSGMYAADPRIVDSPRAIEWISYSALRELTYLGASVLHEDAIAPVREKGIPINIRNTNRPDDAGTWIEPDDSGTGLSGDPIEDDDSIGFPVSTLVGLAGRTGYTSLTIRKSQWSGQFGVGPALLSVFADERMIIDMVVASVDTWTIVLRADPDQIDVVSSRIVAELNADSVEVRTDLVLLGVVGTSAPKPDQQARKGSFPTVNLGLKAADALANEGIWVFAMSSPGGFNTVDAHLLVIEAARYEDAVRCLYAALT